MEWISSFFQWTLNRINIWGRINSVPSQHLLVQSQQWKNQNNERNLLKVNKDDNDIVVVSLLLILYSSHRLLWCFQCWFRTNKCWWVWVHYCLCLDYLQLLHYIVSLLLAKTRVFFFLFSFFLHVYLDNLFFLLGSLMYLVSLIYLPLLDILRQCQVEIYTFSLWVNVWWN